jgi:CRP-like cAMP-binding protein
MINEHVFYKDSAAHRFYFINEGVCEVVASDEQTLVRFMSKGSFFGEIGCLLTGKRSCSIIVRTTTILHSIKREPLIAILEEYPQQYKYLKGVGRQRLQTTNPIDIKKKEGREFLLIHA